MSRKFYASNSLSLTVSPFFLTSSPCVCVSLSLGCMTTFRFHPPPLFHLIWPFPGQLSCQELQTFLKKSSSSSKHVPHTILNSRPLLYVHAVKNRRWGGGILIYSLPLTHPLFFFSCSFPSTRPPPPSHHIKINKRNQVHRKGST